MTSQVMGSIQVVRSPEMVVTSIDGTDQHTCSAYGHLQAITIHRCSGVPVDRAAAERVLAGVAS